MCEYADAGQNPREMGSTLSRVKSKALNIKESTHYAVEASTRGTLGEKITETSKKTKKLLEK